MPESSIRAIFESTFSYQVANYVFLNRLLTTAIMGYEDSVYLAKLAEQAERYEG